MDLKFTINAKRKPKQVRLIVVNFAWVNYASCGSRTHIAGTGILSAIHYTNDASVIYYRKNSTKVKHLL